MAVVDHMPRLSCSGRSCTRTALAYPVIEATEIETETGTDKKAGGHADRQVCLPLRCAARMPMFGATQELDSLGTIGVRSAAGLCQCLRISARACARSTVCHAFAHDAPRGYFGHPRACSHATSAARRCPWKPRPSGSASCPPSPAATERESVASLNTGVFLHSKPADSPRGRRNARIRA